MQYDEALIVTKGAFSVRTPEGEVTARPGEVIFLTAGTELEYRGEADCTEVVYVSYPTGWRRRSAPRPLTCSASSTRWSPPHSIGESRPPSLRPCGAAHLAANEPAP
jgi:hypothetical protein